MTRSRRRKLMRELAGRRRTVIRTGIPVASALLATMPAAYAQGVPATANAAGVGGLEEVVVTAQKRVENLQDVPISVQVLDSKALEQLNIANIDDYVKYTPGIAYVRGEGQGGNGQQRRRPQKRQQGVHPSLLCFIGEEGRAGHQETGQPGPAQPEAGAGEHDDRYAGDGRGPAQQPGLEQVAVRPGPEEQEVARRVDLVGGQEGDHLAGRAAHQEQADRFVAADGVGVDAGQEDHGAERRQRKDRVSQLGHS